MRNIYLTRCTKSVMKQLLCQRRCLDAGFVKYTLPDPHSLDQLFTPFLLRCVPFGLGHPCMTQVLADFGEAFVISGSLQRNGPQRGTKLVGHDHAVAFNVYVPPEIMRIALLPD